MAEQIILRSKKRVEIIDIDISFSKYLISGETITDFSVEATVFTGTDPDPENLLNGLPSVLQNVVTQSIHEGVPGCIYWLFFRVETSLANTYVVIAKQAVLTDSVPVGPLYKYITLTTPPYPVFYKEDLFVSASPIAGVLKTVLQFIESVENVSITAIPLTGRLRLPLLYFSYSESLEISAIPVSGRLREPLTSLSYKENILISALPLSGELRTALVSNLTSDAVTITASPLSGALS